MQSSSLEFFHGDYKPNNVFVKTISRDTLTQFKYKINGTEIKLKNLGFAVVIADFDRSSISLENIQQHETPTSNTKYRLVCPILFKPLLKKYVDHTIAEYAEKDPNNKNNNYNIRFPKYLLNHVIPNSKNPNITILRSAGVTLFRDLDLYTFFIKMFEDFGIHNDFINSKFLLFMSPQFKKILGKIPFRTRTLNESAYIAIKIFHKINEPMKPIFTEEYINTLKLLCNSFDLLNSPPL